MKVAIIGATGKAGSKILTEVLERGLDVTAIVRSKAKLTADVPVIEKAIQELTTEDVKVFDVIVNAFGAPFGQEEQHVIVGKHLIEILTGTDTRLIVVGGAGSLFVDPEKTLKVVDTPNFPDFVKPTAHNQAQNLEDLKASSIAWTFISPSAVFDSEGGRTGKYTLGEDHLLVNAAGESYISYADYAIALVDEIEKPAHINKRFTVVAEKA
jgi:uncharacterized protein